MNVGGFPIAADHWRLDYRKSGAYSFETIAMTDLHAQGRGAAAHEQLTGRPPFRGATLIETLQQVKTAEPVPPSRLVPGLPPDVETIALKCLQKDPGKRYASGEALAEDLRRYQAGQPIWRGR